MPILGLVEAAPEQAKCSIWFSLMQKDERLKEEVRNLLM